MGWRDKVFPLDEDGRPAENLSMIVHLTDKKFREAEREAARRLTEDDDD